MTNFQKKNNFRKFEVNLCMNCLFASFDANDNFICVNSKHVENIPNPISSKCDDWKYRRYCPSLGVYNDWIRGAKIEDDDIPTETLGGDDDDW